MPTHRCTITVYDMSKSRCCRPVEDDLEVMVFLDGGCGCGASVDASGI